MNRREFIKEAVTTSLLFAVSSVGLAELLVKAKSPVGVQGPTMLQIPATTPATGSVSGNAGNQTSPQIGSSTGFSTGTTGGSSGGTTGGSGGSSGVSGGTSSTPNGYIYVASVGAVSGSSAYFNHPSGGSCLLVDYNGTWRAFSAICTHAGCTCNFTGSALYCPCHGASFSASNGAVNSGPTRTPLAEYDIQVVNNAFYVSPSRIN